MKKIVTAFSVKFLLIFPIFNKKNYTFAVINISNYVNIYYICAKTGTLSIEQIANAMELDVRELTDYINTPSPNGAATPSRVREHGKKCTE